MIKKPIRIVIADDNRFFCDALKDSLNMHEELNVVATFTTLKELFKFTNFYNLDVLILDVNFNSKCSLDFIDQIKPTDKTFKIIALTTMNNNFIKEKAINNGVDIFVGKDGNLENFKEIILHCFVDKTIKPSKISSKISVDNYTFTKRKLEILQALFNHSDKKEKELSAILNITESSLKSHKRDLFEITHTKSTPELIKFGIQKGLIIA
ncbi:response regulator transcription factor [Polaribacter sp. IC073]|uniref:response regulator transcription factor n=1 Tax=Polaribacter sp. IC073 TaxID=2508540 RepID=UPI0011BEB0F0|nr:response regulator transcription factor [Polaribacter sp. IC073]TXD49092.1 response regulator transcription factor [Polaribacter sp. IC073]